MRRVSMATRDELLAVVSERYRTSGRADKSRIIDEFSAATGYHRKHVMRVLRPGEPSKRSAPRPSRRLYGTAERGGAGRRTNRTNDSLRGNGLLRGRPDHILEMIGR